MDTGTAGVSGAVPVSARGQECSGVRMGAWAAKAKAEKSGKVTVGVFKPS